MLGRHRALESDAVRLGELVAMAMLDEVKPLLLLERGLEILGPAQQASLTLLADPSLEYGLDEHRAMALDEPLDLILARIRPQDLGSRMEGRMRSRGSSSAMARCSSSPY